MPDRNQQEQARQHQRQQSRRRITRLILALTMPLGLVIAATLAGLAWITPPPPEHEAASTTASPVPRRAPDITPGQNQLPPPPTKASTVPPVRSSSREHPREPDFNLDAIAASLSRLNRDDNGRIQLDRQARDLLEATFLDADTALSETRFETLQHLIEAGLEGEAGRQAAAVAERFYRYSNAYREISDTLGRHPGLDRLEASHRQIRQLRQTYLGTDLAAALYGRDESLARYTLQSMRLQADTSLTPQQRQARQEALRDDLQASLGNAMAPASKP